METSHNYHTINNNKAVIISNITIQPAAHHTTMVYLNSVVSPFIIIMHAFAFACTYMFCTSYVMMQATNVYVLSPFEFKQHEQ